MFTYLFLNISWQWTILKNHPSEWGWFLQKWRETQKELRVGTLTQHLHFVAHFWGQWNQMFVRHPQGDGSWDLLQPYKGESGLPTPPGLWFHFLKSILIESYQPFCLFSRAAFRDCWPAKALLSPIVQLSSQKRDCHSPRDTWQYPLISQLPVWVTPFKFLSVWRKGWGGSSWRSRPSFRTFRKLPMVSLPLSCAILHGSV